jgi:hypothetical protein
MSLQGDNTQVGSAQGDDDTSVVSKSPVTNPTNSGRTMEVRLPQPEKDETLVIRFQTEITEKSMEPKHPDFDDPSNFSQIAPGGSQVFGNYFVNPSGVPIAHPSQDATKSLPYGSKWLTAR